MVFSSVTFIFFFLPLSLLINYLLKEKIRNYWLLFVSLFFYLWGGISFLPILLFSIFLNYIGGMGIHLIDKKGCRGRKAWTAFIIACNIILLIYWKYLNFLSGYIEDFFNINLELKNILLPIGISFFTFQGLSYVVDVYRRQAPAQKNIFYVGLYISLFPQLVAGPIVRYGSINQQLEQRTASVSKFAGGMRRFSIGLAKKAIIANTLAVNADAVFSLPPEQNTVLVAWIGIISYTLQIYFDFSGYSDMAIGIGKMLGFTFPENFNYPYIASSVTDFWRRWHISLSSWFRDYVYIPLGGNRCSKSRWVFNLFVVWSLTGIWHGANWTFLIWGWIYFVLLLLEKLTGFHKKLGILSHIYTLFFVMTAWVFFKSPSIEYAVLYLKSMFGILPIHSISFNHLWYLDSYQLFMLVIACIGSTPLCKVLLGKIKENTKDEIYAALSSSVSLVLLGISMIYVVTSTYNPFIYFQF